VRIDVQGDEVLQGVIVALKHSDAETRKSIRQYTKANMTRPWLDAIDKEASTVVERRVISATATVAVSDQNIRIQSAAKGRPLSGGLNPKVHYGPVEFGSRRKQFKPRNRSGYVFYPAARKMIPRLASLWVQTVVKTFADIFEGRA
jgi:hypothetical protein